MVVAGLTGAIGSGKSVVAQFFAELGAYIIQADAIARALVETDSHIAEQIKATFGADFFKPDGSLDRRALGRLVFANVEARQKLNQMLHPRTIEIIDDQIQRCRQDGTWPVVIVEAALIFEVGLEKKLRPVIVVDAPRAMLLARIQHRDGLSASEALDRLNAQMTPEAKVSRADFVITNDQTMASLRNKVKQVYQQLVNYQQS